jgi:hypothetical protein
VVRFFIMTPPLVLIFTWLYNRVRGSLLILILLHTSIDAATAVLAISTRAYLLSFALWWIAAIVVVVYGRMWRRAQPQPPALAAPPSRSA